MKFHLYFLTLTLLSSFSFLFAQNIAPEVTNVTFSQRTDGSFMVDVCYDVNDSDGDNMTISMQVSDDAGVTFNFSANHITGDIGENITSGTAKHIVWDFGAQHPQTYSDQIQIKVIADDNAGGGETGTVTDIDGNVYQTIKIGAQWWMAENLKTSHYRSGEAIPNITSNSEWQNLSTGAYASYDNDDNNVAVYGLLYNWYAVDDARDLAPAGWHVPTDEEWKELEMHLGMSQSQADNIGRRGTDEGGKLKDTTHWRSPNTGATNESSFSALPGGYRYYNDTFTNKGFIGYWWSSTAKFSSNNAWIRLLSYNFSDVYRYNRNMHYGFSVRCVRD